MSSRSEINKGTEAGANQESYEEQMQKYEAQIRNHISVRSFGNVSLEY